MRTPNALNAQQKHDGGPASDAAELAGNARFKPVAQQAFQAQQLHIKIRTHDAGDGGRNAGRLVNAVQEVAALRVSKRGDIGEELPFVRIRRSGQVALVLQ